MTPLQKDPKQMDFASTIVGGLQDVTQSGAYSLGPTVLGLRTFELGMHPPTGGLQLGAYSLGLRIMKSVTHSPTLKEYRGPFNASVV